MGQAGLLRDGMLGGNGRDADALSVRVVSPAMIGADNRLTFHPPQGDGRPAMDAKVMERPDFTASEPADNHALVQEPDGQRPLVHVFGKSHGMPILSQRRP